jgi:hypothetical protein
MYLSMSLNLFIYFWGGGGLVSDLRRVTVRPPSGACLNVLLPLFMRTSAFLSLTHLQSHTLTHSDARILLSFDIAS